MKNRLVLILVLLMTTLCFNFGCSRTSAVNRAQASPTPAVKGKPLDASDLRKLRWIEGTWRGTGGGVPPFVERYKFESDSVLAVESLEGEKLDKVTDVTRFELKNGEFGGGGEGARWVTTSIDDKQITFTPLTKARNSFRWERVSENSWKAVFSWPATEAAAARERIYEMKRSPKQ